MSRRKLRIVFFGTAEFAVPSLAALLEAGHEILAVVTQPDKPQGRGQNLAASPVKRAAEIRGLPTLQPRRVRAESFVARMRAMAPDVVALAAFGQIIPQALLDVPPLGPINVHGSLLPRYRGAAPIQRAIMAGEAETGVTTMWMEASLDTGDILLARALPIADEDTYGSLAPKMAAIGAELLVQTLDGLAAGAIARQPQQEELATLAPAILPEDSVVRWDRHANGIRDQIRGLSPKPGAFSEMRGRRVKLWSAQSAASPSASSQPGAILEISRTPPGLLVSCAEGTALLVQEAQPESGRRMQAADWARGLRLKPGDLFTAPATDNAAHTG